MYLNDAQHQSRQLFGIVQVARLYELLRHVRYIMTFRISTAVTAAELECCLHLLRFQQGNLESDTRLNVVVEIKPCRFSSYHEKLRIKINNFAITAITFGNYCCARKDAAFLHFYLFTGHFINVCNFDVEIRLPTSQRKCCPRRNR